MRRGGMDDEEEDPEGDPVGTINTPVGEPLILLIFALLYFFANLFAYVKKKYYLCTRKG
jgi:hypothetical protein